MIFDVNIICDKHDNTYRIEDDEGFRNGEVRRWLINTFAMTNAIREARDLDDRISLEQIPSAEPYLSTIIRAIREQRVLNIHYHSYGRKVPTQHDLMPYAIKLFRLRWYVLGKVKDRDGIMVYAMDRITHLNITDEKFKYPKHFNIHDYYRDSFCIIIDADLVCERILLKVMNNQTNYFRSLPLHASQKEIETNSEYSIFEYRLKPTYDFEQEILSHREDVEVLEPASLRETIKESIMKMARIYR